MELKDTINGMLSNDYKERFVAEYQQTEIRYKKLKKFCDRIELVENYDCGETIKHDCPLALLRDQQKYMGMYLGCLEKRAILEGISLG